MNEKHKILIVDDSELNREILLSILEDEYDCYEAEDGEQAIAMISDSNMNYQLVLLDLVMPKVDGYGVLEYMNKNKLLDEIPVIIITSDTSEESIVKAYSLGTFDLFTKPYVANVIKRRAQNVIRMFDQKQRDSLTGGYNRKAFLKYANSIIKNPNNKDENYVLVFFDITHLKAINEFFGIEAGDEILKIFYDELLGSSLNPLLISRLEADHFICLVNEKDFDAEKVSDRMEQTLDISGRKIRMLARFGAYYVVDKEYPVQFMIDKAKLAKESIVDVSVKPYAVYDDSIGYDYINQASILNEFQNSLDEREFQVYLQPVIEAATDKLVSAEALIRWVHPEKGMIPPGKFIPVLEKHGYITRLDKFVLEEIRRQLDSRKNKGMPVLPISINLSWMDFYDENMKAEIIEMLKKGGDTNIRLEITETSYAAMVQDGKKFLDSIKELGIKILLDDFGSGYSSFGIMEKYDFDILKIDMSFVKKIEHNYKNRVIIKKIIELCHEIGIKTVAEGAETKEQVDFLKECGCDYIQGYFYSKPLSTREFVEFARYYGKNNMISREDT